MRTKWDRYFMKVAVQTAKLSHAKRLKVGCVVVKDRRIISVGYNGTPAGTDNCCENGKNVFDKEGYATSRIIYTTKPEVIHAESNALLKLAVSHESSKNATMYLTVPPCLDCAKLIHQAKIKEVIYKEEYKNTIGINFLISLGIPVSALDD